jgi:hypothetical protein
VRTDLAMHASIALALPPWLLLWRGASGLTEGLPPPARQPPRRPADAPGPRSLPILVYFAFLYVSDVLPKTSALSYGKRDNFFRIVVVGITYLPVRRNQGREESSMQQGGRMRFHYLWESTTA